MRAIIRLALVVAAVAGAIWLVPASVHIVSWPAAGPVRVAFLAPLSRLWLSMAIAAAVVGVAGVAWRKTGRDLDRLALAAMPLALLLLWAIPFVPWLPDRAPLLLIFAGPLRWVVAAVAVGGAVAAWIPAGVRIPAAGITRGHLLAAAFLVYALLGVRFVTQVGFGGDEPHYLIIAESLLADHDLDIANNHAQRDYRAFFPGELRPDFLQRGRHGEIYSIHAPGLPALLLPAYAIGGATATVVFIALLAALTSVAIFDLAALLAGQGAALVVWASACFTVPFVPHAWLIYPEVPGALIVAWAVLWLWRPPVSPSRTALHGAALALLPWLHTKFVVLLALLVLFEVIRLWPRWKHIVHLIVPVGVSGVLWLLSFYWMYGVVNPEAPYGSYARLFVLAKNIPRGTLGLLFDQKFGLLVYSPLYILTLAGAWLMLRDARHRLRAAGLLIAAAAFFVSTTRLYMWWGGSSAPARFLVPIVPLLAPMLATAVARLTGRLGRAAVVATIFLSLAIAGMTIGSREEALLYSEPHGVAALARAVQGSAPLDVSLPTFTEENWRAPIALLAPWLIAFGVSFLLTMLCERKGVLRTPFWTGSFAAVMFVAIASAVAGNQPTVHRGAIATHGQLTLMRDYDPPRLHAVNVSRPARLRDEDVLALATLNLRRSTVARSEDSRILEGPFDLTEGRYEARVWFEGDRPRDGEAIVAVSSDVVLARTTAPLGNPVQLPFVLPMPMPAFVGLTDPTAANSVRRVEIVPASLVPRSARAMTTRRVIEPVGGAFNGYMGYTDDRTYPEGGVFWTRGTKMGGVVIATGGASMLHLVLHVGPSGSPVEVTAGERRFDVDLKANETRELTIPIAAGTPRIAVTVRARRSFVPAELDPKSDDKRELGCQLRPVLS